MTPAALLRSPYARSSNSTQAARPPAGTLGGRSLRYAFILLPLCLAIGQEAVPAKTPVFGPQAGPWRISISADKSQYSVGETVEAVALLKNVSDGPVVLLSPGVTLYTKDVRLSMPTWIPWKPRAPALTLLEEQRRNATHVAGVEVPAGWEGGLIEHELNKPFDMSTPGGYASHSLPGNRPGARPTGRRRAKTPNTPKSW